MALGKVKVKRKLNSLKSIVRRWIALTRGHAPIRNKAKQLTYKTQKKLIQHIVSTWIHRCKQINIVEEKLKNVGERISKQKYFKLIINNYKELMQHKESIKLAIKFWFRKTVIKTFGALMYFRKMKEYNKEIKEKAKVAKDTKLMEKGIKGFKHFLLNEAIKFKNKGTATLFISKKRKQKVLNSFKCLSSIKLQFMKVLNRPIYRKAFHVLRKLTSTSMGLYKAEEKVHKVIKRKMYKKFIEQLKVDKDAKKIYEKNLVAKSVLSFRGYLTNLTMNRERDMKAKRFNNKRLKNLIFKILKANSIKEVAHSENKVIEKQVDKNKLMIWLKRWICKKYLKRFRLSVRANKVYESWRKKIAWDVLKTYWAMKVEKNVRELKAKRHLYLARIRLMFRKLHKHTKYNKRIQAISIKVVKKYEQSLKQKCLLLLRRIREEGENKEQEVKNMNEKKLIHNTLNKLQHYNNAKKEMKNNTSIIEKKQIKRILSTALKTLRKWAKHRTEKRLHSEELLKIKQEKLKEVKKRMYMKKLLNYSKQRQIKFKLSEIADINYNKIIARRALSIWFTRYKELNEVYINHIKATKFLNNHLLTKSISSFILLMMERRMKRVKKKAALRHWARSKYKICLKHLKHYTNTEKRKQSDLRQALEDRSTTLRKTAIRKWLSVGLYWIHTQKVMALVDDKTQLAVLSCALCWKNKVLTSYNSKPKTNYKLPTSTQMLNRKSETESKEKELMEWLKEVTKSKTIKSVTKQSNKLENRKNIVKRINEIEAEVLQFSNMKKKLKENQEEDTTQLRQYIITQTSKIKKLIEEISTLKKSLMHT